MGAKMDQSSNKPLDEDTMLKREAADDNIKAFKHLHQEYAPRLRNFFIKRGANKELADDLVQKIFASLWQRHKNNIKEDYFEAYLYNMARNTLYNEIRLSKKMAGIKSIKHPEFGIPAHRMLSQPEAVLYLKELNEALEKAKTGLTNEQYQALQIAQDPDIDFHRELEELGWPIEAYKSHLKRARKKIREYLKRMLSEDLKHKKH